jgi:hypothetical protein
MTMLLLFLAPLLAISLELENWLADIFQTLALVIMALVFFLVMRLLIIKNYPRAKRPPSDEKPTA